MEEIEFGVEPGVSLGRIERAQELVLVVWAALLEKTSPGRNGLFYIEAIILCTVVEVRDGLPCDLKLSKSPSIITSLEARG